MPASARLTQTGSDLDRTAASRRRGTLLVLAAILVAFSAAGLKHFHSPTRAGDFVSVPQRAPAAITPAPQPSSVPQSRPSPRGDFLLDAGFVSAAPGQAVHAASIVELNGGGLRAAWFSGSREGAGDVVIKTAVMDASSLRWSSESVLLDRGALQQGLWRYVKKLGNPVLARAPDGSLLVWVVTVSVGGWAGSSITWARSTDEGASWSRPRRLVTSPFLNISTLVKGAPVGFSDGQIGLPVYHEFITKFAEVLRLGPDGEVIDKVRIPGSQTDLQPVILANGPKSARLYMRSGRATSVTASATEDAGKTWSRAQAVAWPNPDSALAGTVTSSGSEWLALNPLPRDRQVLALIRADDGGRFDGVPPWVVESASQGGSRRFEPRDFEAALAAELKAAGTGQEETRAYIASARRQLCHGGSCVHEFSYPYLLQTRDGYLHLVYTWNRTRIRHVRLDPRQPLGRAAVAATKPPTDAKPHATTH